MTRSALYALCLAGACLLSPSTAAAQSSFDHVESLPPPANVQLKSPKYDDGRHIDISWDVQVKGADITHFVVRFSAQPPTGVRVFNPTKPVKTGTKGALATPYKEQVPWHLIAPKLERLSDKTDEADNTDKSDKTSEPITWQVVAALKGEAKFRDTVPDKRKYVYAVFAARSLETKNVYGDYSQIVFVGPFGAKTAPFHFGRLFFLLVIAMMGFGLLFFLKQAKRDPDSVYIRRIPGVDAIEDAVGRSTEMGRPVLYVTGVEEIQNIQTIASLLVLSRVAEMTAEYDTEIKVANYFPLTMVVAEEIVKQGYANAGRVDAHKPENVMFIAAEQFAFAAGVNGIILRDKPATNIYLGRFFAESLILAETGYVTKAVQIAGTAEITQLPFFIAACDYTIIGEELYAVSAYLSREPNLLATLKATDFIKLVVIGIVVVGAVYTTVSGITGLPSFNPGNWLIP